MGNELFRYSLANFRELILDSLAAAGARKIVEIGSEYGTFTQNLRAYAAKQGGRLISVDPCPQPAALEFVAARRGDPHFEFRQQTSLEALPALADADAFIIDGDHNCYTVQSELETIQRHRGAAPWLVFEHDVLWPWGWRDLYYDPAQVPADRRHPHSYAGGVTLDDPGVVPWGFGNPKFFAVAEREGGADNGVRAGIENFLAGHPELAFEVVPAIFGLGIIYSRNAPWAENLARLLAPCTRNPLIERLEQTRLRLMLRVLEFEHQTAQQATAAITQPRLEAETLLAHKCWAQADPLFERLRQQNPDDLAIWRGRLMCLRGQGHNVLAELLEEEALEKHPEWAGQLNAQAATSADPKRGNGAKSAESPLVVGLILATRFDQGYSHSFGPLGLGYLAASVRKHLPGVKIVMREKLADLIALKPDLIGISSQSENYAIAIQYAKRIKAELDVPVVLGGVHITMLPESLHEAFDLGVVGEGETTFVELLRSMLQHHGLRREALSAIPGLCYRDQGRLHRTAPRELVKDLDTLPPPVLEELPFHRKSHMVCLVSARGCPYHCTFCISEKFSQRYRSLSFERVANDVEYWISRKGVKHVVFYDDLLIANKKRVQGLIRRLRDKRLLGRCTFSCAVRTNLIDEEMCCLLKELGVTDLGMGVESFSDRILSYYNKTGCTGEVNQHAIDLLHAAGIKVNPSLIFGAPIETREDMLITLRKVFENLRDGKINGPTYATLIPYPGTKIWDYALQRGVVSLDMDWDKFAKVQSTLYLCEEVSQAEFHTLLTEWRTRISLLLWYQPERGGSFVTHNRQEVARQAEKLASLLPYRDQSELGDDLIFEFAARNTAVPA